MGETATEARMGMVTGVHAGSKGIHPTPPNSKMDRGSSEFIIPTATEVGRYK